MKKTSLFFTTAIVLTQSFLIPVAATITDSGNLLIENELQTEQFSEYSSEQALSHPQISIDESNLTGVLNETFFLTFTIDQKVSQVKISLPKDSKIYENDLEEGLTTEELNENIWLIHSLEPKETYIVPIVFDQSGYFEIFIGETSVVLNIEENEASLSADTDYHLDQRNDLGNMNITVTKENFLSHFDLHGSARYNLETGTLTLTEAANNQVGNVTLKEKLSVNDPFVLRGKANIGSNSNGADGMAFGFHNSYNSAIGNSGNGMGLAGLPGGFGFKLDSNFNTTQGSGAARDPAALGGAPFAGYVYHASNGLLTTYMGNDAPARRTGSLNGAFDDILVEYLPSEGQNIFRISYKEFIWERDISEWQGSTITALSFLISGSTGARNNRHEFVFEQMDYVIGTGELEVNYRDASTNEEIIPSELLQLPLNIESTLDSKAGNDDEPYILGYDFSHVITDSPYYDETKNTVVAEAERRKITYYFDRAESEIAIHYIDEDGIEIIAPEIISGYVNEDVEISTKEIENYTYLFEKENQLLNTQITRDEQNYWLIYRINTIPLPSDPLDPEVEVEPENKPELPEDQKLLSIDFASQLSFGSQVLSVYDQTYYAQPQRLLNEDGTVNANEERPNYVQISDRRPENERNGWQLAVTQRGQFEGEDNQELAGARLRLMNQQVVSAQNDAEPHIQQTNPFTLVPNAKRVLLLAQGNEGTGTWVYRFGDADTAGQSIALDVPKGATPQASRYTTTLLWELSTVPEN